MLLVYFRFIYGPDTFFQTLLVYGTPNWDKVNQFLSYNQPVTQELNGTIMLIDNNRSSKLNELFCHPEYF